jgi:putative addiction module component (TIGR02574 family)
MSTNLQSLGLEALDVAERINLVHDLWDSIASEVERAALTDAERQEVLHRLAAHRANPQCAIPWEQVEAEALARLGQ